MNTAERLFKEGFKEGHKEGHKEGVEQALVSLLEARFAAVPSEVRTRIAGASRSELDSWLKRILVARTLDEVFVSAAS